MNEWAANLDGIVTADAGLDEAFAAGLPESSSLAFRVAFSVLRHREEAEDVAQEALTRAYRRLHQLRDADRLKAWLVRMTWRLALDRRKSADRRAAREERADQPPTPPSSEDLLLSAERSRHLWQAIDSLSDKLRIVIVLSSIEGHDVAAVARLLGIPEGTVKRRLFDARQQLRERLT